MSCRIFLNVLKQLLWVVGKSFCPNRCPFLPGLQICGLKTTTCLMRSTRCKQALRGLISLVPILWIAFCTTGALKTAKANTAQRKELFPRTGNDPTQVERGGISSPRTSAGAGGHPWGQEGFRRGRRPTESCDAPSTTHGRPRRSVPPV